MLELGKNPNLQACARMMMENDENISRNELPEQESEVLDVSPETAEL